jgi:DNA polymerase I-like protein with 3'-5' exonuclease and polymerase domains
VNGRVYGQFHPLRGDDGGTRSGRYSSSTPNLQNIPARDDELAPIVRGLYQPDEGHKLWRKYDYSQIEYRFLAHFAVGGGADTVRQRYQNDPHVDFHEMTRQLIKEFAGVTLDRKVTKTINFGLIYGMGQPKLAHSLHLKPADGKKLFLAYHKGAPFAKATLEACAEEARRTGTISTVLGRKSRFDLWEPTGRDERVALPYEQARRAYGPSLQRAYTHKALNRRLQGSAADLMKMATWRCMKDGIFDRTGYPRITVHDELDFSDPGGVDDAFLEMQRVMENAIALRVPVKVTPEFGPDWGHCEKEEK